MQDEHGGGVAPAPVSRSLRIVAVLVTLLVFAAAGSFLFRRTRRAAAWFAGELALTVVILTVALQSAVGLWGGLAAAVALRFAAAFDAWRLGRTARGTAPLSRVIGAWVAVSLLGAGLTTGVKAKVIEAFKIPSASMLPNLMVGDHVMVDKRRRPIERGELIVFRYPRDTTTSYLKRVVGIGGDVVEVRDGIVALNGQPIATRKLDDKCGPALVSDGIDAIDCELWEETLDGRTYDTMTIARRSFPRFVVPEGSVFVMGDNRDNSSDSRVWGTVADELIVGRVAYVWYSQGPNGVRWERVNKEVR